MTKRQRSYLALTDKEFDALRTTFMAQLPTVAAFLATSQEGLMDFDEAASDALDLVEAILLTLDKEAE